MAGFKEIIFKPKWQHKDVRIRAAHVARSEDPRLLEHLAEIACQDEAATVRLAALRRLDDIHLMARRAREDGDDKVREHAARCFRQLLTGEHENTPPLSERLQLLAELDDLELLEHLARNAGEAELRGAAQDRFDKPGLLGDVAIHDDDPALRRRAASRIGQRSTLERVADAVRKHDKRLFHQVAEQLQAIQVETGDNEALGARAAEICSEVEHLARSDQPLAERLDRIRVLREEWGDVGVGASDDLQRRFAGGCRVIELAAAQPRDSEGQQRGHGEGAIGAFLDAVPALIETESVDDIGRVQHQLEHGESIASAHADAVDDGLRRRLDEALEGLRVARDRLLALKPAHPSLSRLIQQVEKLDPRRLKTGVLGEMERDWDRAWSALTHPNPSDQSARARFRSALAQLRSDRDRHAERRRVALERVEQRLEVLDQALEAGDLAASAAAQQALLDDLEAIGRHPTTSNAEFKNRLAQDRRRLQELRDWQHWSNNEIRARLCEHAEEIPGSGLHPDAVAAKVKELQKRWKDLDASEKLPGDSRHRRPNQKLWRRFQKACNEAFEAAKPYFEKRAEIRESHLEELEGLVAEIDAAQSDEERTPKELERLLARARGSLRKLGEIPPKKRKRMARRLRGGADSLEKRLQPHYEVVERRKKKLIESVQALTDEADLGKAMDAAKAAQGQWKEAGVTRRDRENRLWKQFRAACDAVFARRDEERAEERAERREQTEALDALLEETRALLERSGEDRVTAPAELPRIRDAWRGVGMPDRHRERRFEALRNEVEEAARDERRSQAKARRARLRELAAVVREAERRALTGEDDPVSLASDWQDKGGGEAPAQLTARFERACSKPAADVYAGEAASHIGEALDLCIRIEFLAGVESPDAQREARMAYQVRRLSERMSGDDLKPAAEEASELEARWLSLGPLPAESSNELEQRFMDALDYYRQHA